MKVNWRLMRFVKKYWPGMLVAFLCLLLSTAFSLVVPFFLGKGIDSALNAGSRTYLYVAAGVIVGASVLRGLAGYGNQYLTQVISQRVSYDIRNELYDHLQKLSFAYHDKAQTGQLMSRATVDIEAVRMFLAMGLLSMISTVIMIVGVAVLMISVDWTLGLMTIAFVPPVAWLTIYLNRRLQPIWLRVQQLIASLGTTLQESMMGIRVVKGFSREKEESRKFSADAERLYDAQVDAARQTAFNMPTMVLVMALPVALVLWYGGRQVAAHTLTIGGVTQFILYIGMLAMPIRRIGFIVAMYSRSVSAGQRILEIFDTKSLVQEKSNATVLGRVKGEVEFDHVSFSYNSMGAVLNNVSFKAGPGQTVALVGGSGSGKSTITNLLSRFYDVTGGRITVDGTDIRDVTLDSLRKNVSIAQQDVFLFSATVRDNIAYGVPDADMPRITEAAKAAQVHEFIMRLPDGYNTWVGERGTTLSGGEKQRMVIARAILMNPAILVLDDSTSSVDAETEHLIRLALERLIANRTTFVITHRLPLIRNADLILVLKDGEIVERGKHDELMARNGLYRQTYEAQLAATSVGER